MKRYAFFLALAAGLIANNKMAFAYESAASIASCHYDEGRVSLQIFRDPGLVLITQGKTGGRAYSVEIFIQPNSDGTADMSIPQRNITIKGLEPGKVAQGWFGKDVNGNAIRGSCEAHVSLGKIHSDY